MDNIYQQETGDIRYYPVGFDHYTYIMFKSEQKLVQRCFVLKTLSGVAKTSKIIQYVQNGLIG